MNADESQYHLLFHFYPYIFHSPHSHYHILLHFNHSIRPQELLEVEIQIHACTARCLQAHQSINKLSHHTLVEDFLF